MLTALIIIMLSTLENIPLLLLLASLMVLIPIATIEFLSSLAQRELKDAYTKRINSILKYMLQVAEIVLKDGDNREKLQIVLMLPNQEEWYPVVWHNLRGKHRVTFPRGTAWMSFIDKSRDSSARIIPLIDTIKDQLSVEEDKQYFDDVSLVLVSPVYKPNVPRVLANLQGALLVYSETPVSESVLLIQQQRCVKDAALVSEKLSEILCYDCLCL